MPHFVTAPSRDITKLGVDSANDLADFVLTLPIDSELHSTERLKGGNQCPLVICRQCSGQNSQLWHFGSRGSGDVQP